jgi:hypothetical protein
MPVITRRSQWLISCVFFAAILLALVIGAILLDPLSAATAP